MRILHHERKRLEGHFSIERVFRAVRAAMPPDCEVRPVECPCPSRGLWPRVRNVRHAAGLTADVHHVTGDVHYLVLGLPPRRTVLTIHDCAALDRLRGPARSVLRHFWFTAPMKRAAVVTTITESTRTELRRHVGALADRVTVVPDCLDGSFRFVPQPFRVNRPVCLQVGTKWNKNVERVAAALAGTGSRLDIVGTLSPDQRRSVAGCGVDFRELGALDDDALASAYRDCDFVAFASLYEGFGLPILEAQATGRPVITSNISSMPEAAGGAALLVDPRDTRAIAEAVRRLISDERLRSSLVSLGLENAARFTPARVAGRYAELYRRLFAAHGT